MLRSLEHRPLSGGRPVRQSVYWLADGQRYLGTFVLRHVAAGRYPSIRSHVYYEVRPSERGHGYGHVLMRLGLRKARRLGMRTLRVACSEANVRSRAIIEAANGRLLRAVRVVDSSSPVLLFNVSTGP